MAVLVLFLHMDDNRSNVLEIIRLVCGCAIALLFNLGSNISTPNLFHRQIPPQCLQPVEYQGCWAPHFSMASCIIIIDGLVVWPGSGS